MNTRHASEDSPFRQERYMSSPELQRGLLANCVAARVQALSEPQHRKLIWWLQKVSWEPGGLDKIAADIMQRWPERFATPSMELLGFERGRIYGADEVRRVRKEIQEGPRFVLRGEDDDDDLIGGLLWESNVENPQIDAQRKRKARSYPQAYPAADFQEACFDYARRHLAKFLFERLCLDPQMELNAQALWYLPRLVETLSELHDMQAAEAAGRAPVTEIGARVNESLEYAMSVRGLVVIDGVARTGKTFAVKAWCDAHPGQARYVQVPSSNDDMSFYRALCSGLGLGASVCYKALELRAKIESALHGGELLLVLDEGHYLWPQRNMRKAVPHRINWLLTQLINMGVPVAVVTTPQFTKSQEALVASGGWSSEQLVGRIMYYERLPDLLSKADLEAVAEHWLPGGNAKAIGLLVTYAQSSEKYLQGVESLVRRACFLARKASQEQPTAADVAAALKESVVPSDNALAAALSGARKPTRRNGLRTVDKAAVQPACNAAARIMQPKSESAFTPSIRDTGGAVLSP
jgi:hypothetical protein